MQAVSVAQMREMDRATIEEHGIAGYTLMERAGRHVADAVCSAVKRRCLERNVLLLAGKGNNGGDVFAAARFLMRRQYAVTVRLTCRMDELKGDALAHFEDMDSEGIPWVELPHDETWRSLSPLDEDYAVLVDGLLGTGASGAPRGTIAAAVEYINRMKAKAYVVAIDIPSGVNGDTGVAEGVAVFADVTISMAAPKKGFLNPASHSYIGRLDVVDIGLPVALCPDDGTTDRIVTVRDVQRALPGRDLNAHKGTFGHALLVGGARGFSGAMCMAGQAAIRSGCGLVSMIVPEEIVGTVSLAAPELMVKPWPVNQTGSLSSVGLEQLDAYLEQCSSVLLGPGMTPSDDTRRIVQYVLEHTSKPVVLDADALNVFAGQVKMFKQFHAPLILTPHPGEMGRLLGMSAADVQRDRRTAVWAAAEAAEATVVLKGAGTLIASVEEGVTLNLTGNPGMARGGSGDVLAGLMTGFAAQDMPPYNAACVSVYLHGLAGDIASEEKTRMTMTPTDLVGALSAAHSHSMVLGGLELMS